MFRAFLALVMIVTLSLACLPTTALAAPGREVRPTPSALQEISAAILRLGDQLSHLLAKIGTSVDPNGTPQPPLPAPITEPAPHGKTDLRR